MVINVGELGYEPVYDLFWKGHPWGWGHASLSEGSLCNWAASWRCLPEPQSNTANYHKACFDKGYRPCRRPLNSWFCGYHHKQFSLCSMDSPGALVLATPQDVSWRLAWHFGLTCLNGCFHVGQRWIAWTTTRRAWRQAWERCLWQSGSDRPTQQEEVPWSSAFETLEQQQDSCSKRAKQQPEKVPNVAYGTL